MQLKWLEDFIVLAQERSFTRAAELRHVTHPAFGRRIRALEARSPSHPPVKVFWTRPGKWCAASRSRTKSCKAWPDARPAL